ncbi:MAG: aminopeptidase P family protein [Candidatus Thorarchaeota archaeon]|nr:aminopeptidase P family protein [Candidatus Thorarchaeota archaeon]
MEDVYLEIPKGEISHRIQRLQNSLREMKLDGAILLSTTELYYYSGIGIQGVVYVPADGAPVRLAERNKELVAAFSELIDIRPMGRQSRIFETLGIGTGTRIAMESDIVPYSYMEFLQSRAEGIELVDGSHIFRAIRSKKSEFEIEQIAAAAELVDKSLDYCTEIATPEMTEIELSMNLDTWLVEHGHAGYITTRAFNSSMQIYSYVVSSSASTLNTFFTPISGQGLSLKYPFGPTRRRIGHNRPFLVDSCGNSNGYISDTTRTLVCGKFEEDARRKLELLQEIKHHISQRMRPGQNLGSLYAEIMELSKELGVYNQFMGHDADKVAFIGHGVGLELDELPIFYSKGPSLEEGNVLASEPKLIVPGYEVLGIEDTYAISQDGCRILSRSEDWIEIAE